MIFDFFVTNKYNEIPNKIKGLRYILSAKLSTN